LGDLLDRLVQSGFFLYSSAEDQPVFLSTLHYARPAVLAGDTPEQVAKRQLAAPYLQQITTPGITSQLRQEVLTLGSPSVSTLTVNALGTAHAGALQQFAFTLSVAPAQAYLTLRYSSDFFARKPTLEESVQAYEQWLSLLVACYTFSHALYAYAWNENGIIPPTEPEYLEQRLPYTLYEINLFGPEMVENMGGLEFILQAPAQITRKLEDGGALLLPEISWYPDAFAYSWAKVARYLHVVKPEFLEDDDDNE
jgi:hypothetical protein